MTRTTNLSGGARTALAILAGASAAVLVAGTLATQTDGPPDEALLEEPSASAAHATEQPRHTRLLPPFRVHYGFAPGTGSQATRATATAGARRSTAAAGAVGAVRPTPDDAGAAVASRESFLSVSRSMGPRPLPAIPEPATDLVPEPWGVVLAGPADLPEHAPAREDEAAEAVDDPAPEPTQEDPAPEPAQEAPAGTTTVDPVVWDRLAACESGHGGPGRWDHNRLQHLDPYSDARFYGGLHFNKGSWDWAVEVGGHAVPYWPHEATREQQIAVAETLRRIHPAGWGAWPECSRHLGLR